MRVRLAAALVSLAWLAAGCGGDPGNELPTLPVGSWVAVKGTLSPAIHVFGDTVTAEADVVVDRTRLDPARIHLAASFDPYKRVGETVLRRRDAGDLTELRFRMRLRCLDYACITATLGTIRDPAGGAPRVFRFDPAQVAYQDPAAKQPRQLRLVRWPPLESVSRINAQDPNQVFGFPFRSTVTPLPSLSYRLSPQLFAALLLGGAAALLLLPGTLAVRRLRRRAPPPEEPEPELSPLERAVQLVEWSLERDGEDRRSALEALAVQLDAVDDGALSEQTRRTAWSSASPAREAAASLVAIVRETHGAAD